MCQQLSGGTNHSCSVRDPSLLTNKQLAYSTINKEESLLESNPLYPTGYGDSTKEMAIDFSTVDSTVIHPVPLQPPPEKEVEARPLPITKAERKRMKKQT